MGSSAHVIVRGGSDDLADEAQRRALELEARWSRFLPDSEVSRLNAAAATSDAEMAVSADTAMLIARGLEARRITAGRFDPTLLQALVAAGYDRSRVPTPPARISCDSDRSDPSSHLVRLPRGCTFDPGGIGKGLAADIISAELMAAGAEGVLVNLGGDLRVRGVAPDGGSWRIDVEDPRHPGERLCQLSLDDGAVATSSRLRRRWTRADGTEAHHLIDPSTATPSASPVLAATAIAANGWQAEVLAKLAFLDGVTEGDSLELIERLGAATLIVTETLVASTSRWSESLTKECNA